VFKCRKDAGTAAFIARDSFTTIVLTYKQLLISLAYPSLSRGFS